MKNKQIRIGYDIFEAQSKYNHDDYYHYAEDNNGVLYKTHYGHDGDQDWYITCYENLTDKHDLHQKIDVKYYYKNIGRVPFTVKEVNDLSHMVGKTLTEVEIKGEKLMGFIDYDENLFYKIIFK